VAAGWSKGLATGRALMRVEVGLPHVVVTGPVLSMCQGSGSACWSKWFAVGRARMRTEVDVLHAVVAYSAGSLG
jgi:hypothetical protein